jgi:hypothetical protein
MNTLDIIRFLNQLRMLSLSIGALPPSDQKRVCNALAAANSEIARQLLAAPSPSKVPS